MNFITRILGIDVPANTTFHSWEPSFRGLTPLWLIILSLIVLFGMLGVAFFYRLEKGTLGWIRRILLIGLRCTLLLLLLFLIMRPMLLVEFKGERPQGVVLLIDNSQSMQQKDRRLNHADKARVLIAKDLLPLDTKLREKMPNLPSVKDPQRMELVKNMLTHDKLKLVNGLHQFGPLRTYFFGYDVRGLRDDNDDDVKKILAGFSAEDGRTALADSIMKILQSKDSDPPSAIVVFSDGQDNASKFTLLEAAEKCKEARVPLHIYGVGSAEGGQLQLKEVGAPDTLFAEDAVTIPVRWRAQGFTGGKVEITMTLGGKLVDRKEIDIQTGEDLRTVLGFMVPKDSEKRESQDLVTTIKYKLGGETYQDTLTRTLRMSDTKIKILYIEHSPRWEFKFLQPALIRDRRIDVDFILVNAAPEVAKGGKPYLEKFPETRDKFFDSKYNLIILGDVASSYFTKEQQEWIREFVQNRGGLIVMAGRQNMPSSYENSPIAEVLPIEFKKEKFGLDAETRTKEYMPTLTEAGQRTEWLALADTPEENLDVWQKKVLAFHWSYPVVKLRPAATSLIVRPDAKMGEPPVPMPVLASHYYGKGQVLWLGTDETWRWRWNYQDKYFVRLWGQIIYQLGLPSLLGDGAKRAHMAFDRSQAIVGTQSTIYVRLLDKDFNPRKDPKVDAELEFMDAKEDRKVPVTLTARLNRPGEYTALIPHQRAGRFELRVKNPDINTFSYRVDLPAKHELEEAGLAEKTLRDAALLSGGAFYREENLYQMIGNIEMRTKPFTRTQEVLLWNPLAILLFLGLITTEWLVRKFSDLS